MRIFQRIIGVPGVGNLGAVKDGAIYRSAQPEIYEALPQYLGIKSVLYLREDSKQTEVEAAGMKFFSFRLNVFSDITFDDFDLLSMTMADPENQPILIQ
jgi:protein tyrosine/serine phosphatase